MLFGRDQTIYDMIPMPKYSTEFIETKIATFDNQACFFTEPQNKERGINSITVPLAVQLTQSLNSHEFFFTSLKLVVLRFYIADCFRKKRILTHPFVRAS